MCRTFIRLLIYGFFAIAFATAMYSDKQRNYWEECYEAGKKSQEDWFAYIDALSVDQLMLLGKQIGEEFEQKAHKLPVDEKRRMEEEYLMALGFVHGYFLKREVDGVRKLGNAQRWRAFVAPVTDSKAPFLLRKSLMLLSSSWRTDYYSEFFRREDYKLIGVLMDIIKSPEEDDELRAMACRQIGRLLHWEHKNPAKPLSDNEKKALSKRIGEDIELCKQIASDTNAPPSLRKTAENSLRGYEKAGITVKRD